MKKKEYIGLVMNQVETELRQSILTGSVTMKTIKANKVEVEEFEEGFEGGFQSVDFD